MDWSIIDDETTLTFSNPGLKFIKDGVDTIRYIIMIYTVR